MRLMMNWNFKKHSIRLLLYLTIISLVVLFLGFIFNNFQYVIIISIPIVITGLIHYLKSK